MIENIDDLICNSCISEIYMRVSIDSTKLFGGTYCCLSSQLYLNTFRILDEFVYFIRCSTLVLIEASFRLMILFTDYLLHCLHFFNGNCFSLLFV